MTKAVQDLMVEVARVRDAFGRAVLLDPDPDAALALATDDCALAIAPSGTVATGHAELSRFVAGLARPADLAFRRRSRTGDRWQVADEETVSFTHDRELPWLLPGVAATHRPVEVLVVTVVAVRRSRVHGFRMLWDQVSLHAQLGL